ncbi:hypothetical protein C900_03503 [Fulvivirga imtechensis AK7]|uniref:Secretion system C-terminal sorting domain-containing protein n=1 Tax=Fulvivirga imtechensis AK7 TaxID=1237149 RepID=L8JPG5_9BACT|nr:hypothetical protein [Fulvivirga imtechensis]ELR70730.1 hypothetical protein C900_03503 [Fulvivirga imtechensis AK7]
MKTFRKFIIAVVVSTGLFTGVYGTPYVKVTSYDAKKFFVIVKSTDASRINVSLKDSYDFELYKESYKNKNNYVKGFDLEPLPDGQYFLEIESNETIEKFSLSIRNNWLSIDQESRLVMHKPRVTQKGNNMDVALLNTDSTLKLSILDKANEVIFQEIVADNGNLSRRYDISQLDPGYYTVLIEVAGRNFRERIHIK